MTKEYLIKQDEVRHRLKLLRKEMIAESLNELNKIREDFRHKVFPEYKFYKEYGLNTQESLYCALMDCGFLKLEDLK